MKIVLYSCTRCGYETKKKHRMHDHLYKRKKTCQGIVNDIVLTDEIKEKIIENRRYNLPKTIKETKTPIQIYNNQYNQYNILNNLISSINTEEKLEKYTKFTETEITGIEFDINDKYDNKIKRLEGNRYKYGMHLKENDILEIVDNISKVSDNFEDFNVLYDADMNKVKLFSRSWSPYLIDTGIKKLIEIIQDSYLYAYEMYLIKKIYDGKIINEIERNKYKISLEEYYKFMNIFDIQPYCVDKTDNDIIENGSEDYIIQDKIYKIYNEMKISKSEINKLKKTVTDIIKNNSKYNVQELNKKVISLLNLNEEFKNNLMENLEITKFFSEPEKITVST
jgi:hypothetical protein